MKEYPSFFSILFFFVYFVVKKRERTVSSGYSLAHMA